MRVGIDVENRSKAEAVQRSLEDPLMKTVVIMNGLLQALGSAPARERALHLLNTSTSRSSSRRRRATTATSDGCTTRGRVPFKP